MHSTPPPPQQKHQEPVKTIYWEDKEILLVGTAHVSQASVDLVETVIEREKPDCVCIELDANRYESLSKRTRWENLDLKQVIRKKQLSTLLVNLILGTYQKKLGGQLGVMPGSELLAAAQVAKQHQIPIELCDRDIRITLRRAWHATSFFKKGYLIATLVSSLFNTEKIDEAELARLRQQDVLSGLMDELAESLPATKQVLIDERDVFMAEKIKTAPGQRIVAVVGAGHLAGICAHLQQCKTTPLAPISIIPPVSKSWKIVGWSIPAAIILSIGLIGWKHGLSEAGSNLLFWILANGIPAAIGAIIAWGHPLTIFSAFAAAPVTSLTPVIGAGYVTAFTQVMTRPPLVKEFEAVSADIGSIRGWWSNKLLRVFLVFLLTGFGSNIGTWVGGYKIANSLFS